jgi:hypothetical protein
VRNAEDGPKSGGGSSLARKEWISATQAAMGKETSRKALLVFRTRGRLEALIL